MHRPKITRFKSGSARKIPYGGCVGYHGFVVRKSFLAWIFFVATAQLAIMLFEIDRWPFTCYPMYAVKRWYQSDVLHVGAMGNNAKPIFLAHPLNWMMNGPRFDRPLTPFESRYVRDFLAFACPSELQCRILKTKLVKEENGSYGFRTEIFQ